MNKIFSSQLAQHWNLFSSNEIHASTCHIIIWKIIFAKFCPQANNFQIEFHSEIKILPFLMTVSLPKDQRFYWFFVSSHVKILFLVSILFLVLLCMSFFSRSARKSVEKMCIGMFIWIKYQSHVTTRVELVFARHEPMKINWLEYVTDSVNRFSSWKRLMGVENVCVCSLRRPRAIETQSKGYIIWLQPSKLENIKKIHRE